MERQRGLTLLEMLIAIMLFSTVMALVGSGFRYYVVGFSNNQEKFNSAFSALKYNLAWQEVLSAGFYYFVPVGENKGVWFEGSSTEVSWASTISLQQAGQPAIAWLGLENNTLVYCERLLIKKLYQQSAPQKEELCSSFRLDIMPVQQVIMEYYRWGSVKSRVDFYTSEPNQILTELTPQWLNQTSGLTSNLIPEFVRITLMFAEDTTEMYWIQLENNDVHRQTIFMLEQG